MEFDKIASGAWNPNLAVPLAHSSFNVYDILAQNNPDELVVINPATGAIALSYKSDLAIFEASSIVSIEAQSVQSNLSLAELGLSSIGSLTGTISDNNSKIIEIATENGIELHSMHINNGLLTIQVSTHLKHDVTINLTFPEVKKSGVPLTKTIQLNYNGSLPQTAVTQVDLNNSDADFTLGNTDVNKLAILINTTISGTGNEVSGSESISFDFQFSSLDYQHVKGYFGQNNIGNVADSILLRIFQNATEGYFEFTNPSVNFFINNDMQVPSQINFHDLKTINIQNGQELSLVGYPSTVNINSPTSMGQSASTTWTLNTSNTQNLNTIITPTPKFFNFDVSATINPSGNPNEVNIIERDDRLTLSAEVSLPLEGLAYGFRLIDTVDFNLVEDPSNIESVLLRLYVNNGFPVQFVTDIIFADENYVPVFSVFTSPKVVVASATVDGQGKVNQNTEKITDALLTPAQIAQLGNVKYILINGVAQTLNALNGQIVKFFDTYKLDLKLSTQVQGKIGL
ncbi:MAG TPA: hypothetical protein VKZ44_07080 [Taishania sp.]|nr:hypothetical protein [Taishania sp.]